MSWITRLLRGPEVPVLGASGEPVGGPVASSGEPRQVAGSTQHRPMLASVPITKFREGYDIGQVDALVDRVVDALDGTGPAISADEVLTARFAATKFREGYDQDAVDDLLDRLVVRLREG